MPLGKPVWMIGRTGQLATSLRAAVATDPDRVRALARPELDLARTDQIADTLAGAIDRYGHPAALINCAAYTQVDQAEVEPDLAMRLNADAPARLADFCAAQGIPLLHVSTDYVFDGRADRPYSEADPTAPINVYGRSKLAGETAILASSAQALILRTSWVFSGHGRNFLRTMLDLGRDRSELRVVDDQVGAPTSADDIAAALLALADRMARDPGVMGLYHFAGDTDLSWAAFARRIFAASTSRGGPDCTIIPVSTADYGAAAARPPSSRLDCSRIADELGLDRPSLAGALDTAVDQVLSG